MSSDKVNRIVLIKITHKVFLMNVVSKFQEVHKYHDNVGGSDRGGEVKNIIKQTYHN